MGIRDQNETANRHAASEKLMTTVRCARRSHVLEQFRELAAESARAYSGAGGGLRRGYAVLHEQPLRQAAVPQKVDSMHADRWPA